MSKRIFKHKALELNKDMPLVYTAMSKHLFYFRMFISKFVLEQGGMPLNPFMIFDYFLLDSIDRGSVREANNNCVRKCDEIRVFGAISDGVLSEIKIAKKKGKKVRYFSVLKSRTIHEVDVVQVEMEPDVVAFRNDLLDIQKFKK